MSNLKWHDETKPKLNINKKKGTVILTVPLFEDIPWLNHGISTRIGGVSGGCCSSLNLSFNQWDDRENVAENYRIFCKAADIDAERIATTAQVHGNNVELVTADHCFDYFKTGERDFKDADGMVTNVPHVVLFGFGADCPVIMLADTVNRAVAVCHSGWRGTVEKIAANAIKLMADNFGTKPKDILAAISPSICQDCYEVGTEVIDIVREKFPQSVWPELFYENEKGRYQLSLWNANRQVLTECGIEPGNIFLPNLCTKCNTETFFSHRAMGEKRGLQAAFMEII